MPIPEMLTVKEVAEMFKVNERTVRLWVKQGDLQVVWIGKREYRIVRASVEEFIEKRQRPPAGT